MTRITLHGDINKHVEDGSNVFTNDSKSYSKLKNYYHRVDKNMGGKRLIYKELASDLDGRLNYMKD